MDQTFSLKRYFFLIFLLAAAWAFSPWWLVSLLAVGLAIFRSDCDWLLVLMAAWYDLTLGTINSTSLGSPFTLTIIALVLVLAINYIKSSTVYYP